MKLKHPINLHKGLTSIVVLGLMVAYHNFSITPWVYLALHGTYGLLWLIKDAVYPDRQWEEEISIGLGIGTFLLLGAYWLPPFLLISSSTTPPAPLIALAIATNIFGVMLHFVSDAQKHFTLKYRSGLITEGFFESCRNTNYLGEILIYLGFAMLVQNWLAFLPLSAFIAGIFVPNMLKKDRSLARYPQFAEYQTNSGLLIPKLFSNKTITTPDKEIN
jgi:protein-S-isoprenylcysteine O-methyltransferase Ste14